MAIWYRFLNNRMLSFYCAFLVKFKLSHPSPESHFLKKDKYHNHHCYVYEYCILFRCSYPPIILYHHLDVCYRQFFFTLIVMTHCIWWFTTFIVYWSSTLQCWQCVFLIIPFFSTRYMKFHLLIKKFHVKAFIILT